MALEEEDPLKVKKKLNNRDTGSADTQEACKEMKENTNKHTHNTSIKELHMDNSKMKICNQKKVKSLLVHLDISSHGVVIENNKRKLQLEKLLEDKEAGKLINNLNLEEIDMT